MAKTFYIIFTDWKRQMATLEKKYTSLSLCLCICSFVEHLFRFEVWKRESGNEGAKYVEGWVFTLLYYRIYLILFHVSRCHCKNMLSRKRVSNNLFNFPVHVLIVKCATSSVLDIFKYNLKCTIDIINCLN